MKYALLIVFLSSAIFAVVGGTDDGWDAPESEERLRVTIEQEIGSLDTHPWAGCYFMGDGLGTNIQLTVAPKSGFTITWHGCVGLYGHNYGTVIEKDERLVLVPELPNNAGEFASFDLEYIPVEWGERHYLVAAAAVSNFCNEVNSGWEPRKRIHGMTLLRRGNENKKAEGLPELPAQYKKFLLPKPIHAKILSVGSGVHQDEIIPGEHPINHEVTIDAGAQDGVYEGLEFYVAEAVIAPTITITSVQPESSTGNYSRASSELYPLPEPSWKLSTRPRGLE
ncbi:MAG: hypothetical protein SGI88_11695 [Candidatus Hydrogenedentes bacterium]|nr:hypothetical protein [Candidatus Hydrogenedentota bacterium]